MKIVNFINPCNSQAYDLLIHCIFAGFEYKQTHEILLEINYYIPEDQFNMFKGVCDIMLDLDIGQRYSERRRRHG